MLGTPTPKLLPPKKHKQMKHSLAGLLLLWAATLQPIMASQGLWGAERNVVINGQLIVGQELMLLDALNGEFIPAGRYWLNVETGAWGYEGGPQQGVIKQKNNTDNRSFDETVSDFCVNNPGACP